jgi:VanZ family protein
MFATTHAPARPDGATSLMRALSLLALGAVLYATLHPWTDWRLRHPGAFAFLAAGIPRYWTWFDFAANLLAYLLLALLVTLAWFGHVRTRVAVPLVAVGMAVLSFGLETLQGWLPGRVPSVLDWLANAAGAAMGAALGGALNRGARGRDRVAVPVRERWYEQGSPLGWLLLLVWAASQLAPQRLLFSTGRLDPLLHRAGQWLGLIDEGGGAFLPGWLTLADTHGVAIEAAVVICAMGSIAILACDLVRSPQHRLLLLAGVGAVALGLRTLATQMVYGAAAPFAWLTPGAQGGLVVGIVAVYGLATLSARSRAGAALLLVAALTVLVHIAPAERYFDTMASGVVEGQLRNLHAVLRFISAAWPVAALGYFWLRLRGRLA